MRAANEVFQFRAAEWKGVGRVRIEQIADPFSFSRHAGNIAPECELRQSCRRVVALRIRLLQYHHFLSLYCITGSEAGEVDAT